MHKNPWAHRTAQCKVSVYTGQHKHRKTGNRLHVMSGIKQRILVFKLPEPVLALDCTASVISLKEWQKVNFSAHLIVPSLYDIEHFALAISETSVIVGNAKPNYWSKVCVMK
jgi:hypothetical protein